MCETGRRTVVCVAVEAIELPVNQTFFFIHTRNLIKGKIQFVQIKTMISPHSIQNCSDIQNNYIAANQESNSSRLTESYSQLCHSSGVCCLSEIGGNIALLLLVSLKANCS